MNTPTKDDFSLLETMLVEQGKVFLWEYHKRRLLHSAVYFGIPLDINSLQNDLAKITAQLAQQEPSSATQKVLADNNLNKKLRLLVDAQGHVTFEIHELASLSPLPIRLAIDTKAFDAPTDFVQHKTTNRQHYDVVRAKHPHADDVLLWNSQQQLTETIIANVVCVFGNDHLTPALEAGLLPGTYRQALLDKGSISAATITKDDLHLADDIYLINSVRKGYTAKLII